MTTRTTPLPTTDAPTPTPRRGRLARLLRRSGLAVLIVLTVGMGLQTIFEWNDALRHPAPGDFVTVADGRQFHYMFSGTNHDGPVVILEAGGGSFSPQWARIQEEIADFAQVLSYDRAGMGWSE